MIKRRAYRVNLIINGSVIKKVIIDPHYEEKHSESINDELILELVKTLHGVMREHRDQKHPYLYFTSDKIEHLGKFYKLIWLLEEGEHYLGVINAYRR